MVVSAAGISILLRAASVPLQDLAASLNPGAVLNGRVVELLPQNQALVSLRGQNVVAQLPAGSALAKGDILSLLVVQANPGEPSTSVQASLLLKLLPSSGAVAAPSGQAPSASLGRPQGSDTAGFGPLEAALGAAKLPSTSVNLALAQTLSRLGAPLDAPTLQALSRSVESLISNELPRTSPSGSALGEDAVRQTLQEGLAQVKIAAQMGPPGEQTLTLMQAARSLEEALQQGTGPFQDGLPAGPAQAAPQNWPATIERAVQSFLDSPTPGMARNLGAVLAQAAQAKGSATDTARAENGPALSTAGNPETPAFLAEPFAQAPEAGPLSPGAGDATAQGASPSAGLPGVPDLSGPAQATASLDAPRGVGTGGTPSSAGAPKASGASEASAALSASTQSLDLAGPNAAGASLIAEADAAGPGQNPVSALLGNEAPVPALSTPASAPGPASTPASADRFAASASANTDGSSASSTTLSTLPMNSADIPAMREALAQWLGPMVQDAAPLDAGSLSAGSQALADSFSDSAQGSTQRLTAAVQAQSPQSSPAAIQSAAGRALQQIADFYGQLPAERPVPGVQAVQADLKALGLPVPTADLATLPPETVASAVAWLSARGLPAQRPLVETVAGWMDQDLSAMPAAQRALQGRETLGDALQARPSLKQAYETLSQAMESAGLNPESDGLAGRLQSWASAQGLTLESDLGQSSGGLLTEGSLGADSAAQVHAQGAAIPGNSLRGALLHLENELNAAVQSTQAASSPNAGGLNNALRDAQAAVRGFNALPLQAQGAPSFDTVHLPMPVWMNGALGEGRLSVTWRQGRERELDDRDPVNVAVSLNTESLGPVTVTLQVWKNSASARVIASDKETAAFMAQGAEELRSGFSENTPFALQSLEFSTAAASPAQGQGPEAPSLGLSLSA